MSPSSLAPLGVRSTRSPSTPFTPSHWHSSDAGDDEIDSRYSEGPGRGPPLGGPKVLSPRSGTQPIFPGRFHWCSAGQEHPHETPWFLLGRKGTFREGGIDENVS